MHRKRRAAPERSRNDESDEERETPLTALRQRATKRFLVETNNDQYEARLAAQRQRNAERRLAETDQQHQTRLTARRQRAAEIRLAETDQHEARLTIRQQSAAERRLAETDQQHQTRLTARRQRAAERRLAKTADQHEARLTARRQRTAERRLAETADQHEARLTARRQRTAERRLAETADQHEARLTARRQRTAERRLAETDDQHEARIAAERQRNAERHSRELLNSNLNLAAFNYIPLYKYSEHKDVIIGKMINTCVYCKALKFKNESPGMCCSGGKVKLPSLDSPPEPLKTLMLGNTNESKHFLNNIRKYNSTFQMTSFGATNIIQDNFMPTFKIQGQIYHRAGSLLPLPDEEHKYLQIYFIENKDIQIDQRCRIISETRREIIAALQTFFEQHNKLIDLFKTAIEQMPDDTYKIVIKADKTPTDEHVRRYNAPTIQEVAIITVGDECESRDILLHRRNGNVVRVSETHRSYDALQYPIIFWQGEDGYQFNTKMINPETGAEMNKKISAMKFYSYRLMIRANEDNHILRCRQLFHQYVVDMYAKIETERLLFIRLNQTKLRSEQYIHLKDAVINDGNTFDVGRLTILPSSYTGSPRHMHEYAQDALTYVRHYGCPDLFITFTCNPAWDEIKDLLLPGQSSVDRHDITARVFRQKLKCLMDFLIKRQVFGAVRCWMYSVEWQKRGLPHAHILIWLYNKIRTDQIDDVISAEIPDEQIDKQLYDIVKKNMIHGPCGSLNPKSPCMIDGKCSKRYPRTLTSATITGDDGYPLYKRRSPENGGNVVTVRLQHKDHIQINNQWVVPYSPLLSKTFNAHINVEYCNSVKSIKYICKYVNKGCDMAVFTTEQEKNDKNKAKEIDEIAQFQAGRYISSNEAVWRIFSFPIHDRSPAVLHLAVHLENGQRVYFTSANVQQIVQNPQDTTLTAYFALCQSDAFAKTLLYSEVPHYYTWNISKKSFERRKRGETVNGHPGIFKENTLGRLYTIHPNQDECYFLRMLLINVPGPTSFQQLKTVDGVTHVTFRSACQALNLLENDNHWDICINDACSTSHPKEIRSLFAIILTACCPSSPNDLWEKYKSYMAEDIISCMANTNLNDAFIETLTVIENLCMKINNKRLHELGMPSLNRSSSSLLNVELYHEQNYDKDELLKYLQLNIPKLTSEQKGVYERIIKAVNDESGEIFFLDAPGGTGKTFLIKLILATIRSQNGIALAYASSGIAATLLPGGRTAHSGLRLPLNINIIQTPICNITKNSGTGKLLKNCKIIIWDECTMAHKKSLEALDRTLQDIRGNSNKFGNALILLAGDFRQTLPIISRSTPADEINASIKKSILWRHVKTLKLIRNMRIHLENNESAGEFSRQLLEIGDGKIPTEKSTGKIILPQNIANIVNSREELINKVFADIQLNYINHEWLSERCILATKNKDVNQINHIILSKITDEAKIYKSVDTVVNEDESVNYPTEFLNSLDLSGMPPHVLELKVGVPIILLRNIHQPKLCNGTRLTIKSLLNNVIEATIITGPFKGEDVLIPRIPMVPTDLVFGFKRLQFPIRLAFAVTVNKAQGQSLKICGIDLESDCFSHGQLYVACSRVGNPDNLFINTKDGKAKNIVYKL